MLGTLGCSARVFRFKNTCILMMSILMLFRKIPLTTLHLMFETPRSINATLVVIPTV